VVARIGFYILGASLVFAMMGCAGASDDEVVAPVVKTEPVEVTESTQNETAPVPEEIKEDISVTPTPVEIENLSIRIIEKRSHSKDAFSQGFEFSGDRLFESRGLYGESGVSEIDPSNGEVIQWLPLGDEFFGEGLTVLEDTLIQLTWINGVAYVIDIETFAVINVFDYEGEGWGLCFDGELLYMSDGSSRLTVRDPDSFLVVDEIPVMRNGVPVQAINELECVGDDIYANVWRTNDILMIDRSSGNVGAVIDGSGLLTAEEAEFADVLNGIAYIEESETFLITGKLWPSMFEVIFE